MGGFCLKNNKIFIEKWEKNIKKGKFLYIISNIILFSFVYWLIIIILMTITGEYLHQLRKYFPSFIIFFLGDIINSFIRWNKNIKKYNYIVENNIN